MQSLQDPVTKLKGVGAKRAQDLATLGIDTVADLLTYYPTRYNDLTPADIQTAKDKQKVTLVGQVVSETLLTRFGYRRNRLSFRLQVGNNVVMVTFFNQPYLEKKLAINKTVTVMGKWDARLQQVTANRLLDAAPKKVMTLGRSIP